MIEIYMNLPKIKKRGLEDCWKIKKFQSRRSCINLSAGRKRECKNSLFNDFCFDNTESFDDLMECAREQDEAGMKVAKGFMGY